MVTPMFNSVQKLAETLVRREKREDLKLLAQSYVNALKNEAKKPGRHGPALTGLSLDCPAGCLMHTGTCLCCASLLCARVRLRPMMRLPPVEPWSGLWQGCALTLRALSVIASLPLARSGTHSVPGIPDVQLAASPPAHSRLLQA